MKQSNFQWLRARIFPLALLSALMLPFQNCSQAQFGAKSDKTEADSTLARGGNGTGYGGKVYTSHSRWSNCNDGTSVFARFTTVDANTAILDRQNCLDINGLVINIAAPAAVHHYSALRKNPYDLYVYDDRAFLAARPVVPLSPNDVFYICHGSYLDANGVSQSLKIVQSDLPDANGQPTLFVATAVVGSSTPREILLDPLDRPVATTTAKGFTGSNASGTYTLNIDLTTSPRSGVFTFAGPSLNIPSANLNCYLNQ